MFGDFAALAAVTGIVTSGTCGEQLVHNFRERMAGIARGAPTPPPRPWPGWGEGWLGSPCALAAVAAWWGPPALPQRVSFLFGVELRSPATLVGFACFGIRACGVSGRVLGFPPRLHLAGLGPRSSASVVRVTLVLGRLPLLWGARASTSAGS